MNLSLRTAVVVSLAAVSAQAATFSSIVSFGDSLSDAGNFSAVSGGLAPGSPGYSGGHFSNGSVWVEQLAPKLGLTVPTRSVTNGTDYAYGNATTGTGTTNVLGIINVPNIRTQITNYAAAQVSTNAQLFTVLGGANDFFNAVSAGATASQAADVGRTAAANIVAGVGDIYADGGRNVLVSNLPNLANLPRFRTNATLSAAASSFSQAFNTELAADLATLGNASPGLKLYSLDLNALFNTVTINPPAFGLTNVTDAAYVGDPNYLGTGVVTGTPATYLFYDEVHPTTGGHSLIAAAAASAVPEPGLAALAVAVLPLLRRRRAA